jgi:hypothetical protein
MTENEQPTLNLQELASMANIIDICSQRGAFKANELKQVGELYEKIVTFVNYINEKNNQENSEVTE